MSITARGKGFEAYVAVKGVRKRRILPTREEAERWAAATKLSILEGREAPQVLASKDWTLLQAVERCHAAHWKDTKGEKSVALNCNAALAFFGRNVYANEVTTQRIAMYIEHLKGQHNSNGTINRKVSALSKVLKYAMQSEALDKLPYIPRQKESQGRLRFLTKGEEDALLSLIALQWSDHDLWECCAVLLDTGMRCGELAKVEGKDVRNGQVTIWDTKNGRDHTIPLTKRASTIITGRVAAHGQGKLFPTPYDALQKRFTRAVDHLGLTDVTLHTLRHTFASRLVQKGIPIQTVSKLLNHSTIQMTMRYAHLAPSNLADAIAALD